VSSSYAEVKSQVLVDRLTLVLRSQFDWFSGRNLTGEAVRVVREVCLGVWSLGDCFLSVRRS
jgi:hypothetical protein